MTGLQGGPLQRVWQEVGLEWWVWSEGKVCWVWQEWEEHDQIREVPMKLEKKNCVCSSKKGNHKNGCGYYFSQGNG